MTKKIVIIYLMPFALLMSACSKSPFDRTKDASNGGATGTITPGSSFVIFNNELVSGGGAFEYPSGDNQSLSFTDTSNPISRRSIRYSWTGAPAQAGSTDHTFAGFDLMHTATFGDYAGTPGRNLTAAGYSKVTFMVRGSLSTNTDLKVEVADDGNPSTGAPCITLSASGTDDVCGVNGGPNILAMAPTTLTSSWREYTITFPNSALTSVKDFFKATFVFTDPFVGNLAPGQGGTVYIDVIQYKP